MKTVLKRNLLTSTMLYSLLACCMLLIIGCKGQAQQKNEVKKTTTSKRDMKLNTLTEEEKRVILYKGTDMPFTGELTDNFKPGVYQCRQCNTPLYVSNSKFHSDCGWPSFDQEIEGAVTKVQDADGYRTEIVCTACGGHLGHVFYGEGLTDKDTRHCVNTTSLKFVAEADMPKTETAIFAGGCFWGVEYYFENEKGVKGTQVGYTGGNLINPTYEDVLSHTSGHYEAIEVTYDPAVTNYETLAKLFFEIHDPTQANGQGNDIGQQYQSVVFYENETQKQIAQKLIKTLENKGFKVATTLKPATKFYDAENYHQNYYDKNGGTPYCHNKVNRF